MQWTTKSLTLSALAVAAIISALAIRSIADTNDNPNPGGSGDTPTLEEPGILTVNTDIPVVPLEAYVATSTDVVDFVVTSMNAGYSPSGLGCTRYGIAVTGSARGDIYGEAKLYVGGSEDTWPIVRVAMAPALEVGKRYIAFLTRDVNDPNVVYLQGLRHGLYQVEGEGEITTVNGLYATNDNPAAFFNLIHAIIEDLES